MTISLQLICEQLQDKSLKVKIKEKPGPFFEGIRLFSGNEHIREDILYIDNGLIEEIPKEAAIVTASEENFERAQNAVFAGSKKQAAALVNSVIKIFERFGNWSESIRQLMVEGEDHLQELFDLSRMVTKDTVYITDASMKMHYHSRPTLMTDISAIWRYQETYGYMPVNVINSLIETGEMERINSFKEPFTLDTKTFNNPYTCQNFFRDNSVCAHLFIISLYSKPNQTNKEIAAELKKVLAPFVASSEKFAARRGKFHENFFCDLVSGRLKDEILIGQQIEVFGWNIHDRYSVFVSDVSSLAGENTDFLLENFSAVSPDAKAFENGGYLVCVFRIASKAQREYFLKESKALMTRAGSSGAFSGEFDNLCSMSIYYRQAAEILNFCIRNKIDGRVYFQENIGLYGIIEAALKDHRPEELCHPDIISLFEYDAANNTEYAETFFQYLINDRNIVKTAQVMYAHRNTVSYRLERIRELLTCDENNNETRMFLIISVIIMKYFLNSKI